MIQRHPVRSFDKKLNFWEEFPDFKLQPVLSDFYAANRQKNLKESSLLMWAFALIYDRESSFYPQPEKDKWEVIGEDLFANSNLFDSILSSPGDCKILNFPLGVSIRVMISKFIDGIDTPLGISLRRLEDKLSERTTFIVDTAYSVDSYAMSDSGRQILVKGTADQLDKMFTNTDKISNLITKSIEDLRAAEGDGKTKGDEIESLSDGDKSF